MIKDFNKIVKKLSNKCWNVVFKSDIFDIIDPEHKAAYESQLNKTIYRLKSEDHIISLKSWVYIIPDEGDRDLNSIDLLEKYYLKLLKKYIVKEVWSYYYVSWVKSLQFHLKDQSIPLRIYITNKNISKKIQIGNYEIVFKTLSWKDQGKKINLYSRFNSFVKKIQIDDIEFKISSLELSLLESALVVDTYEWLDTWLLVRAIKKYSTVLDYDVLREIGKYKYNMSVNRLKEISKTIDENLYRVLLNIIKQNGGCFVWEGLRGM